MALQGGSKYWSTPRSHVKHSSIDVRSPATVSGWQCIGLSAVIVSAKEADMASSLQAENEGNNGDKKEDGWSPGVETALCATESR